MVTEASSGRQAMQIVGDALAGQFDVLIIDAQMPDMQGAALAEIRARAEFADVPFLMMSSAPARPPWRKTRVTAPGLAD